MKNISIVVLALALLGLGGWTFYTLKYIVPAQAEVECRKSCTAETTQVIKDKVTEVASQAEKCVVVLEQLKNVPACAAAMQAAIDSKQGDTQATTTIN